MPIEQVVLIGAGNVGWSLGHRFKEKEIKIAQVFSRQLNHAQALAKELSCGATNDLQKLPLLNNCLYLIAVKDDSIADLSRQLSFLSGSGQVIAHTSGAISSEILGNHFEKYGVFYPLQTLSKERPVDFAKIPICVYAPDHGVQLDLSELAHCISDHVQVINDEQRKILHVAAVFVNNFSNHLFTIGKQIVESEGLDFDLLRPLILETAAKIMDHFPEDMQTGPAKRKDQQTILTHLQYLQKYPEWQNLYRLVSHSLQETYNQKS